jgi:hypothetical protein
MLWYEELPEPSVAWAVIRAGALVELPVDVPAQRSPHL